MHLSLFSDYSLRVLMFGVLRGSSFSLTDVAEAYSISRHHLVKVVNHLSKLGYLQTRRGRGGGIELAKAPEDIRIGAVVRATENHHFVVECFDAKHNTCPINGSCRLKGALAEAVAAFYTTLDKYTLRDLVSEGNRQRLAELLITSPL